MRTYNSIIRLLILSLIISGIILTLSWILTIQYKYEDKISAYECGFDPIGGNREPCQVHFFLVGISFLIFDIEIAYLFPWSLNIQYTENYIIMYIFLGILTLALIYEWLKGGLEWQ